MTHYPRNCQCIRDGGRGEIILVFSDQTIPWKCPRQNECQHLKNMQDAADAERGDAAHR